MKSRSLIRFLPLVVLLMAGCVRTYGLPPTQMLRQRPADARVLVMSPDIEIYELTAGGMLEPRADSTDAAKRQVSTALAANLGRRNVKLVEYRQPIDNPSKTHAVEQLVKLHDVVGAVISSQLTVPANLKLPTKKERLDWGLGPEVRVLREDHDADYGLFIFFRDAYSSPGRIAVIVVGILVGIPVAQGQQVGRASLVDLRTGEIIWFNLLTDLSGDLRTPEAASNAVTKLLDTLPL